MIESAFNRLFRSEFLESYRIAAKLIKTCPNVTKMFDSDQKKSILIKNGWMLSKMVEFWLFQSLIDFFDLLIDFIKNWLNSIKIGRI